MCVHLYISVAVSLRVGNVCGYWVCVCMFSNLLINNLFPQGILLASVIFFLRRFDRMSKEARRTTEESIAGGDNVSGGNEYAKDRST